MAQQAAINSKDLPDWQAKQADLRTAVQGQRRQEARRTTLVSKTFENLSNKEKDKLLKSIAVQLGLIQDSDDA